MHCLTFFSQGYLPQAHVLIDSILEQEPSAQVLICLLDERAGRILETFPQVRTFSWSEVLDDNPEVSVAIEGRKVADKIFTSSPAIMRHALTLIPEGEVLIYLDADIALLGNLEPVLKELGNASVGAFPHRFSGGLSPYLQRFGLYNAGALLLVNNYHAVDFLSRWASKCIDWCFDYPENGNYSNQGYLTDLVNEDENAKALSLSGGNVAPWNAGILQLKSTQDRLAFNSSPISFFHYHGLELHGRHWHLGHLRYLKLLTPKQILILYSDYVQRLTSASNHYGFSMQKSSRFRSGIIQKIADTLRLAVGILLFQNLPVK